MTRRQVVAAVGAVLLSRGAARAEPPAGEAGRRLDFEIEPGAFGDVSRDDLVAVLRSAAETIWRHCPDTRWEVPGFYIFHREQGPIILDAHRPDGRIAVGLTPQGMYWAQFAFQFAHEFCHALAGHSNDWRKPRLDGRKANQWLEESFCETASLFALRAMSESWRTAPPYPNWKSYAGALNTYAADRLHEAAAELPQGSSFAKWFKDNEPAMRRDGTLRKKNLVVAARLLPLFEAAPSGWEAMTAFNLGRHAVGESLNDCFANWRAEASEEQREFIDRLSGVFSPPPDPS